MAYFLACMLLSLLWTCVFHVSLQCQGVSGILIVTMVTGFMLVYNSSSGGRSPSSTASSSSSSSRRLDGAFPSTTKPQRDQTSTLEGYTGVMDHKVNMHHVIPRPNKGMILNCFKALKQARRKNTLTIICLIKQHPCSYIYLPVCL